MAKRVTYARLPRGTGCCYARIMEPEQTPPTPQEKQLPQKLLKYLPIYVVSHALVTVPTFIISIALAYATFVQADATRKIQVSETYPFVSYGTSNTNDGKDQVITFNLANDGVGPARLKGLEFVYRGQKLNSPRQFLQLCCGDDPNNRVRFISGSVNGMLRPGERHDFIRLEKKPENEVLWEKLNVERWKVDVKACYCSIFDDCWVMESANKKDPTPVDECPADWTLFEERAAPQSTPAAAK